MKDPDKLSVTMFTVLWVFDTLVWTYILYFEHLGISTVCLCPTCTPSVMPWTGQLSHPMTSCDVVPLVTCPRKGHIFPNCVGLPSHVCDVKKTKRWNHKDHYDVIIQNLTSQCSDVVWTVFSFLELKSRESGMTSSGGTGVSTCIYSSHVEVTSSELITTSSVGHLTLCAH